MDRSITPELTTEKTPFLIRQKNLEPNGSSVNPHPFVYSYDLDFDDGTP